MSKNVAPLEISDGKVKPQWNSFAKRKHYVRVMSQVAGGAGLWFMNTRYPITRKVRCIIAAQLFFLRGICIFEAINMQAGMKIVFFRIAEN